MLQQLIRNKTVVAAISIITGIYLMIARRNAIGALIQMISYALFVMAVVYLVMYFVEKDHDQVKLGYACGAAVLGLLARWVVPAILNIAPVLIGIAIIAAGVSNLMAARNLKYPTFSLTGPVLTIVLGVVVLFFSHSVISTAIFLAGVALVLNGLSEMDLIRRIW